MNISNIERDISRFKGVQLVREFIQRRIEDSYSMNERPQAAPGPGEATPLNVWKGQSVR